MGIFEILRNEIGEMYFRLKASNGQVIVTSNTCTSMAACQNGIDSVKKHSHPSKTIDLTKL
tara:strand:- start:44 stop:226 length:183 start_codon:yes stop_codon:yes gene_type:complete